MNTTVATENITAVPSGALRHRHPTLMLILAMVLAVAGLLASGATSPASAVSTSTATVCFKHGNGSPYTYDIYAQRWTGSAWVNAAKTRSVNGCVGWTVSAGYYWRFQAFY